MKRIFAVLVVLAMVFGVAMVASAADTVEFCGVTIEPIDKITIDGTTATMKGSSETGDGNQGYFWIMRSDLDGDFSIEFDYNIVDNSSEGNKFNFEGKTLDNQWFVLALPESGKHARLEGTNGGAWKLLIDGTETASGTFGDKWERDLKVGFTNQKAGSFEATVSNLVLNQPAGAAATGDVTAIIALVAVLAGGVLVFSKKH